MAASWTFLVLSVVALVSAVLAAPAAVDKESIATAESIGYGYGGYGNYGGYGGYGSYGRIDGYGGYGLTYYGSYPYGLSYAYGSGYPNYYGYGQGLQGYSGILG